MQLKHKNWLLQCSVIAEWKGEWERKPDKSTNVNGGQLAAHFAELHHYLAIVCAYVPVRNWIFN